MLEDRFACLEDSVQATLAALFSSGLVRHSCCSSCVVCLWAKEASAT